MRILLSITLLLIYSCSPSGTNNFIGIWVPIKDQARYGDIKAGIPSIEIINDGHFYKVLGGMFDSISGLNSNDAKAINLDKYQLSKDKSILYNVAMPNISFTYNDENNVLSFSNEIFFERKK